MNKRLSNKIQAAQNKCIRFFLNLKNTAHIGVTEFKAINRLPTKNRIDQCVCVNIMKFFKGIAPAYSGEIFYPVNQGRATRRSKFKLEFPFRKSNAGQKSLSYLGPKIWNSLPSELKSSNNINTFKHKIKENFSEVYKKRKMTYMSFTKDRFFLDFSCFADKSRYSDHISLVIPQEGPLWKQGCIDLFNAIPAIFSLEYFLN